MFKNYFKTAFRNFGRNKIFSFINVSGLAIGISASLVIYMIVSYEFSFDKFEKDGNRIYRVVTAMMFPGNPFKLSGVAAPLPVAARKNISGIEAAAHFELYNADVAMPGKTVPVKYKGQDKIIFADDNYFSLFNYTWINGSPAVLKTPFRVVLVKSRAEKYFGTTDINKIIGGTVTYNDSIKAVVAGIVNDNTETSDVTFKEFISLSTIAAGGLENDFNWDAWGGVSSTSQFFVKLNKGVNFLLVQKQVQDLQDRNSNKANLKILHVLQPLSAIHFDVEYDNFSERQSQENVMYGLLAVAAFLLLLGCINFINLTTSQGAQRAKEIGIRKTMGSTRKQLVLQFLAETFVLTLIATILSVAATPLLLKAFAAYIPRAIGFNMITQPHVIIFLSVLIVAVSVLSGFYPALVLSRFKPISVLKNQVANVGGGSSRKAVLRKSLTVAQFVIAQFFIIGTIVVSKQIHYALNADLGYKKDAIINIDPAGIASNAKKLVLLNKLKAIPEVENVVFAGAPPANSGLSATLMHYVKDKKNVDITAEMKAGDSGYFKLYKMKLLAGRYLQTEDSATGLLVNNTYAQQIGFTKPADAVGQLISYREKHIPIVGVLADVHTKSMHTDIKPLVYFAEKDFYFMLHVALKPRNGDGSNWKNAIAKMEAAWKQVYPDEEFDYAFFDESIAKFYAAEQSTSTLLTWATGLAIFISCLGLLGLAIYTTNQRTKEIGVRKVLGASVQQIVLLLSADFVRLIILAFVIAVPVAWFATYKWLQAYPFHTSLSWWVFAVSGLLLVTIAVIVLSAKTIKAASANPVKSLRTE
jgi:ABC-type antimicrobial peptide transport system permease subunit